MSAADPRYVAARCALLDALVALEPHAAAVIIAGAQAVYLHTGTGDLAVAPFTTDADLALDPEHLASDPLPPHCSSPRRTNSLTASGKASPVGC
jgi:hypothetical protein